MRIQKRTYLVILLTVITGFCKTGLLVQFLRLQSQSSEPKRGLSLSKGLRDKIEKDEDQSQNEKVQPMTSRLDRNSIFDEIFSGPTRRLFLPHFFRNMSRSRTRFPEIEISVVIPKQAHEEVEKKFCRKSCPITTVISFRSNLKMQHFLKEERKTFLLKSDKIKLNVGSIQGRKYI